VAVKQDTRDYNRKRREPGRIAAIILAVLVHAAFVMLLVFGVSWQSSKPEPVQAELWSKLPPVKVAETKPEPAPEPPKPEPPKVEPKPEPPKVEPRPEPPQPTKAEIELKNKLEKQRKEKLEREKRELEDKKKKQDEAKKKREAEEKMKKEEEAKRLAQEQADAAARKAATDKAQAEAAVRQAVMNDWINKIKLLVKSRANVPETVTGKPVIEVRLKLLVNGVVFEAQIAKASGNRVYDDAVERAIAGIRQWPVPSDPDVFRNNREIILKIDYEK
jgi:colicin import membrane protein